MSKHRQDLLEKVYQFAAELCEAVDCEAEDIGGPRPSGEVLRDLGPAVQSVEDYDRAQPIE